MVFSMFERTHHQKISKLLSQFDSDTLSESQCFFGGGTAIAMALEEYRESVDIDFICASSDGYRLLRNITTPTSLGRLMKGPVTYVRDVVTSPYNIRTIIEVDGAPIKVEFVREARIEIVGHLDKRLGVPTLSRNDLYAEKLLANADRGLDRSTMSRDAIDLAMMIRAWGPIPDQSWIKVREAYGDHVDEMLENARHLMSQPGYLLSCLTKMKMDPTLLQPIMAALCVSIESADCNSSDVNPIQDYT